jgi:hypothetical protein
MDFLNQNQFSFILLGLLSILLIWNIFLHIKFWQIKRKLKTFFNGRKASDLEGVLFEEIKRLKKAEGDINELFKLSKNLNEMAVRSIQKVGIIRFNPFKETGGDQSFVIALLDANDNGVVISSLFTRQGTRIYSKPIEQGKSKYPLTQEEKKAIHQAQQ